MSILRLLGAAGVLLLVLASPAAAHQARHHHHHKPKDVKVQLLAFNDFHGNLQTDHDRRHPHRPAARAARAARTALPTTRPAGGAAILGSYVRELERRQPQLAARLGGRPDRRAARCCRRSTTTSPRSRP